jgi:NitT/TauT family transport system substrate-binding protein
MQAQHLKRAILAAGLVGAALLGSVTLPQAASATPKQVIRIGYFANLTHGSAIIARQQKLFEKALGPGVEVQYATFTVGTAEIEAIKGGAIDIGFVGPNPALSGYAVTQGQALEVISGATAGGAALIVKPSLIAVSGKPTAAEIAALRGKSIADPGLGGTQDVALRTYLLNHGLYPNGVPQANIIPMANADTLAQFKLGKLAGAWVPEPWATRLIQEGKGKLFVDEAGLWKGGLFPTTLVVARRAYLAGHGAQVASVLKANLQAIAFLNNPANRTNAIALVQKELAERTGKTLVPSVISNAFGRLRFNANPLAAQAVSGFKVAKRLGLVPTAANLQGLHGVFNLSPLNRLLTADGKPAISVPIEVK